MNHYDYAPIVLFVYNRKQHVEQAIEALKRNTICIESELYIYSDGVSNESEEAEVQKVREYCRRIEGFRAIHIIERQGNYGVERNEIEGLNEIFSNYEKCIVLEDDIEVGSCFLEYMNRALWFYRNEKKVISISAYTHIDREMKKGDVQVFYFSQLISPWGWATWADRWKLFDTDVSVQKIGDKSDRKRFDLDGGYPFTEMLIQQTKENHITWDLVWYITSFSNQMMSLTPAYSMVNNIGMDGSGVHYNDGDITSNRCRNLEMKIDYDFPKQIIIDEQMRKMEKRSMGRRFRLERRRYRVKKVLTMLGVRKK